MEKSPSEVEALAEKVKAAVEAAATPGATSTHVTAYNKAVTAMLAKIVVDMQLRKWAVEQAVALSCRPGDQAALKPPRQLAEEVYGFVTEEVEKVAERFKDNA